MKDDKKIYKDLELFCGPDDLREPIYFSKINDPNEFPKQTRIWVGHPWIARHLARFLNWIISFIN